MRRVVSLWLPTWPTDRLRRRFSAPSGSARSDGAGAGSAPLPLAGRGRGGGGAEGTATLDASRPPPPTPPDPDRVCPIWAAKKPISGKPEVGGEESTVGASDRPLVTAAKDGARRIIAATDARAAELGLRRDMPIAHARTLVPDLAIAEADPEGDAAALERLAAWCLRYAPLTCADPPDGIWIDATGADHLHGGEAALLVDLVGRLTRAGFTARTAFADTPGAAYAVARYGPANATVVPPGETASALARLRVAALRLPTPLVDRLHRLGFERIGPLEATPRGPLARRFGSEPIRRLDQAHGRVFEPIDPVLPPAMPRRRQTFFEPLGDAENLARVLGDLAALLVGDLEKSGIGARRLDALFRGIDGRTQAIRIGTARPSRDAPRLAKLLAERLETVDPGFGIESVILCAPQTEPLEPSQLRSGLAGEPAAPDLSALVDVLANRLGSRRLYRLAPVESDVPERSVRRLPPLAPASGLSWPASLPRPSRLLQPPEPVTAMAVLPDDPPLAFTWRGTRRRVRSADGPERVLGEWWRATKRASRLSRPHPEALRIGLEGGVQNALRKLEASFEAPLRSAPQDEGSGLDLRQSPVIASEAKQSRDAPRSPIRAGLLRSARNDGEETGFQPGALDDAERDYFAIEDEHGARYWLYRTGPLEAPHGGRWFLHGLF